MLHQLGWLHALDIQYDASTFDTDPFEPQPDGMGTIFPFWVPCPEQQSSKRLEQSAPYPLPLTSLPLDAPRAGYVELPYTLPQDSTLFLVFQETTPEIWLRKLDWIAGRSGMALVNVHPDYMDLGHSQRTNREYPAGLYFELLRHVARKHAAQFWNPTPRKLAAWFKSTRNGGDGTVTVGAAADLDLTSVPGSIAGLRGKRAAVLLYSNYPADPRPRRAAEALAQSGVEVHLLCLSETESDLPEEQVGGVRVFRLPMTRQRGKKRTYLWQYSRFLLSSFWFLTRNSLRWKYDLVHVHNMPDVLVFSTLVPKLLGAKIILDLHDPMPELAMDIYGLDRQAGQVSLLRRLERWSIGFADLALTPNVSFKKLFVSRSCRPEKIQIVMNTPEETIFSHKMLPDVRQHPEGRNTFRIIHHGLIAHRHGLDLLVEAVSRVRTAIPGVRLELYGANTPFLQTVFDTAQQLGVADIVRYHGPKSQTEIAQAIREAHLGVIPNRRSAFTELNLPTRIFEYLAMGCPVIAPATQGIRDYFDPDQLVMFEPGNVDDLAAKILWVWERPNLVQGILARGIQVHDKHLWAAEKARFLDFIASALDN
jgi:glycosyltransferase involved in cell wall biosynthesis